jgi:hypothetical protein
MSCWALVCKNCGEVFAYSPIADTLVNFFVPLPPDFPPQGLECECASCKAKFTYQRMDLRYRFEPTVSDHPA